MNGQLPRLLTIAEVANCLRMSKNQVYLMVAKKTLPYIRLSERRIVVSEDELVAFIQRQGQWSQASSYSCWTEYSIIRTK